LYDDNLDKVFSMTTGNYEEADVLATPESISLIYESNEACPYANDGRPITFTNQVMCDRTVKGQGIGKTVHSHITRDAEFAESGINDPNNLCNIVV
jgi:hypothetical protein